MTFGSAPPPNANEPIAFNYQLLGKADSNILSVKLRREPLELAKLLLFSGLFKSFKMQKWSNDVSGAHAAAI